MTPKPSHASTLFATLLIAAPLSQAPTAQHKHPRATQASSGPPTAWSGHSQFCIARHPTHQVRRRAGWLCRSAGAHSRMLQSWIANQVVDANEVARHKRPARERAGEPARTPGAFANMQEWRCLFDWCAKSCAVPVLKQAACYQRCPNSPTPRLGGAQLLQLLRR
jgi:hypothetical protein